MDDQGLVDPKASHTHGQDMLDFWNVNVPERLHTAECPPYLAYALENEKDRKILSTPDSAYKPQSWGDVHNIIHENRIDLFQRLPSQLRLYREYCAKLVQQYGTVMEFVVQERLQWKDLTPRGKPFEYPDDVKILYNDWPYGVDSKIVHLVVWTKFHLEDDPATDDLTPETRKEINDYVDATFCKKVKPDHVIWFKNWASLKSIHAVEHFHVMLYDPDMDFVRDITGGDTPLAAKVGRPDGTLI